MKKLLLLFSVLLAGASGAWSQRTVTVGSQVTAESSIVSGRAYILKTGAGSYITDNDTTYYDVSNSANSATEASVYFLIGNGDGTWKIKNYYTGKYWGVPVYNSALSPVAEAASAGAWSLNFSSNIAYPSAPDADETARGIDRSDGKVWGWSTGNNDNHKVYIYEVGLYNTFVTNDIIGKTISLGDAVSTPSTNTWYVIKNNHALDGTYYRGAIFENSGALYHDGSVATPSGANYLFRLEDAGDGKYYVQTAYGNYWTDFTDNAQVGTRTPINGKEKITIAKIDGTDGHFYFQSSTTSVVLNANGLTSGVSSGNVVGWSTTVPTSTGGNNDWGIYEVTLTDFVPTASEIYTINNTNANRGALTYAPAQDGGTKWVWSSGKSGAAFNANNANHRWIIYPTGTAGQYYLYNVGAQKFAVPEKGGTFGSGNSYTWAFSTDAVAVTLNGQSDGTYKFITATGDVYLAVSNTYTGPIINYNDVGGNFTLTKVDTASDAVTTQVTAAVGKLIVSQTPLTTISDEWCAIRIKSGDYSGRFVYNSSTPITYNENEYPLGFYDPVSTCPTIDNPTYYTRIRRNGTGSGNAGLYYTWQLPDGRYIQNGQEGTAGDAVNDIGLFYNAGEGGFTIYSSYSYMIPLAKSSSYFIGRGELSPYYYDIYPINLTTAGLTAWQVTVDVSATSTQLTCSRDDVSGLTAVYNNGYIFLPTSVTPTASDFTVTGSAGGVTDVVEVDAEGKTLTVKNYATIISNYIVEHSLSTLSAGAVGYPTDDADLIAAYTAVMQGTKTATTYNNLKTAYEEYLAKTDVKMPEDGKVYTFTNVQASGHKFYLKSSGGTMSVQDVTEEGAEPTQFICHKTDDGQYAFISLDDWYWMIAPHSNNAGKVVSQQYSTCAPLTLSRFYSQCSGNSNAYSSATAENTLGLMEIKGKRNGAENSYSVAIVKDSVGSNAADFNVASSAFFNTEYSSAYSIQEVIADYYNKVKFVSDGTDAYASLYLPIAITIPEGVTAYGVTGQSGSRVALGEIVTDGILPKETAAILVKEGQAEDVTVYLSPATDAGSYEGDNLLGGTVETKTRASLGTGTTYVLGNTDGIGLYRYTGTNLAKGKAYLFIETGEAKVLSFSFDDDMETVITSVGSETEDDAPMYDLSGRRILNATTGLYIRNGKKFIVK